MRTWNRGREVIIDVARFLEDVTGRYSRLYAAAISDLFSATALRLPIAADDARAAMREVIRETMGVGEVMGARLALQSASKAMRRGGKFAAGRDIDPTQTLMPRVTFTEAVDDMIARAPVTLQPAAERIATRIAALYSNPNGPRVIAFAHAAEQTVTQAAHEFIIKAMSQGIPEGEVGRRLVHTVAQVAEQSAPWTEAYAKMAFRTNVGTAVTAGRRRQAADPDIREVIPAFRFDAVGDSDTRPNHGAAQGIILSVDDPQWNRIAPPMGYNCRCSLSFVSAPELEAMGRIDRDGNVRASKVPSDAYPDHGFRHEGIL
jgi:SPP1 gp7 family putative phage head morphogenesis protein